MYSALAMYNLQNFDLRLPRDTSWYDQLPKKLPPNEMSDIFKDTSPKTDVKRLEKLIEELIKRVEQLENVIAGDGK
jgi:polyhydroxyalkanoate synthesis regulator phasin